MKQSNNKFQIITLDITYINSTLHYYNHHMYQITDKQNV